MNIRSEELGLNVDGFLMGITDDVMKLIFENPEKLHGFKFVNDNGEDIHYTLNLLSETQGIKTNECVLKDIKDNFASFKIIKEHSFIERRNFVKVKTKIIATIYDFIYSSKDVHPGVPNYHSIPYVKMRMRRKRYKIISLNKSEPPLYRVKLKTPFKIRIDDVSAGGMLFSSNKRIKAGRMFAYLFDQGDIYIPLTVKILRMTQKKNGDYAYGCKFIGLSDAYVDMLCQWVFKKQAENSRI